MKILFDFKMPKEKKPQFDVVADLKELSNEADKIIFENLNQLESNGLNDWISAVKDTILKIANCPSVENFEFPPHIKSFLGEEGNKSKNVDTAFTEVQREQVHATVQCEAVSKTLETNNSTVPPVLTLENKCKNPDLKNESYEKNMATPIKHPCASNAFLKCRLQLSQISTPQMKKINSSVNALKNSTCISQNLMETPILNRTFNKTVNKTPMLVSDASCNKSQKANLDSECNDSGTKTNMNSNALTNSSSTSSGMVTRKGMKRKSSSKSKKIKKSKTEEPITPSKTSKSSANKTAKSRKPLVDKNVMKTAVALSSEKNSKMSAIIVPPIQKRPTPVKEKLMIEEIKKKEEKANENIKRILAERQMKSEQNKKNREEKTARTLEKRKQIEKEKELRLQKAELEAKKSQAKPFKENTKNSVLKTRTQELIDQHVKASMPGVLTAKQNVVRSDALPETPHQKNSEDYENYELTPVPNSSTYNFSDDEDDRPVGKPIPLWAQGVHLKSSLVQQYYNPPNLKELFGTEIESPDLSKMFCVDKKSYLKRTSSAVWNHPPSVQCLNL